MSSNDNNFYYNNEYITNSTTATRTSQAGTEVIQSTTTQAQTAMKMPMQTQSTMSMSDLALNVNSKSLESSNGALSQQRSGLASTQTSTSGTYNGLSNNGGLRTGYEITNRGVNEQGNRWDTRDYGPSATNQNPYHYSNRDGSYYYSNPNGSKYYNDGQGASTYTTPYGWQVRRGG